MPRQRPDIPHRRLASRTRGRARTRRGADQDHGPSGCAGPGTGPFGGRRADRWRGQHRGGAADAWSSRQQLWRAGALRGMRFRDVGRAAERGRDGPAQSVLRLGDSAVAERLQRGWLREGRNRVCRQPGHRLTGACPIGPCRQSVRRRLLPGQSTLSSEGNRPPNYRLRSARAITMRWIWFVPSYIWVILASRIIRSTGKSLTYPEPPRSWTASVVTSMATSEAKHLAAAPKKLRSASPRWDFAAAT